MMRKWLKRRKEERIVSRIVEETNYLLKDLHNSLENQLSEISIRLDVIESEVELINKKMATKEIRDRQDYGHLTYKVQELSRRKASGSDC